jgi:hypothetical protein
MKKIKPLLAILTMAALIPVVSRAQFFKSIVDNMKQTLVSKQVNNSAQSSAKPDSSARMTGSLSNVLAKLPPENSIKSTAGISPADSAAIIKSFMTGRGGSGILYQYKVSYTFKKKDSISRDTLSMSISEGRELRSDMSLFGAKMEILGHASLPGYSMVVYPGNKTYLLNISDSAALNANDGATYQVSKIGAEKLMGYNCIHSRLTVFTPGLKAGLAEDIWTSTEVPGYSTFKKLISVQNVSPKMMRAIEESGSGGFFVKMSMQTTEFTMEMMLITADFKTFPASVFQIPDGYKLLRTGNMFSGLAQAK